MVIIDASIVYKWFNSAEEYTEKAFEILNLHLHKLNVVVAPDILLYELANVWATKTSLTETEVIINLNQLKKHALVVIPVDFALLEKAMTLSKKQHISVYDAAYVVLAKTKKCDFITADAKLVKNVNLPFVKLLKDYNI